MGSGGGSQVVYYVPTTSGAGGASADGGAAAAEAEAAQKVVTPAVAKSLAADTARAQEAQMQERQRAFGISSMYNRYKNRGQQTGNSTLFYRGVSPHCILNREIAPNQNTSL